LRIPSLRLGLRGDVLSVGISDSVGISISLTENLGGFVAITATNFPSIVPERKMAQGKLIQDFPFLLLNRQLAHALLHRA
jgi:hypothetical protein